MNTFATVAVLAACAAAASVTVPLAGVTQGDATCKVTWSASVNSTENKPASGDTETIATTNET